MSHRTQRIRHAIAALATTLMPIFADAQATSATALLPTPARKSAHADSATMLGASWAGERAIAVGDHGIVLLSDDRGSSFRQAGKVPVSTTLTGVSFVDDKKGWAVGHWGAIVQTLDGGETWAVQRISPGDDRPLFAVHFFDAKHGVAVGLWSLVLTTADGGTTWTTQTPSPPPGATKADLNLLSLFTDSQGRLYATAEKGLVLQSEDRGHSWRYLNTGYAGSLWTGAALPSGTLLVGGLRGSMYRSGDGGSHWERIESGTQSSITGFVRSPEGELAYGLDGVQLLSRDDGRSFQPLKVAGPRLALTAALARPGMPPLMFSRAGVVKPASTPSKP